MKNEIFEYFHSARYKPLAKLGEGAMGVVLKCEDTSIKRFVAMKLLNKNPDDTKVTRLQTEARAIAKLEHPNIIKILDFGLLEDGQLFLTMECIEGESLEDRLQKLKAIRLSDSIPLLKQICLGMKHSHDHGVLHRDLKPSNILISKDQNELTIKLADFGIAKIEEGSALKLTRPGAALGSPPYMSPEAIRGEAVSKASDIYSFGCVLFEMLTGNPPFLGDSAASTMMLHINTPPPTLEQRSGIEFPEQIEKLAARCLAKDPEERFGSFDEVLAAIKEYERGTKPDSSFKLDSIKPSEDTASGKSLMAILGILALMGIGLLGLLAWDAWKELNKAPVVIKSEAPPEKQVALKSISEAKPYLIPDKKGQEEAFTVMGNVNGDGSELEFLKNRTKIRSLLFRVDNLKGDTLKEVVNLPLLKLRVIESEIDSKTLSLIGQMKELEYLDLIQCYGFENKDLKPLSSLSKLKALGIEHSILNNEGIETVLNIKTLETLILSNSSNLDFSFLAKLKKLPNLKRLGIGQNQVSERDFAAITNNTRLKELEISHLPKNFLDVAKTTKIGKLCVKDNDSITNAQAVALAGIKSLYSLKFLRCKRISDSIKKELKHSRPDLEVEVTGNSDSYVDLLF